MAPRTRSNRIEIMDKERILAKGGVLNSEGFPALPDEIYLEIISYLPARTVPTLDEKVDAKALRTRHFTLFALSQTCRSLRRVFLRYLWQRIEVFDEMETSRGPLLSTRARNGTSRSNGVRTMRYAHELIKQLETVTVRNPGLSEHVNVLDVVLVAYSVETVLAEVARCMALLPNLHTVQFEFFRILPWKVEEAFAHHTYPQVRSLSINRPYEWKCFPQLRSFFPYMNRPFWSLPANISVIEALGSTVISESLAEWLVLNSRNLRDITIHYSTFRRWTKSLEPLRQLPHLHAIRISIDGDDYQERNIWHPHVAPAPVLQEEVEQWVKYACNVLCSQKTGMLARKSVIVTYKDGHKRRYDASSTQ